jgi:hypothetical protein
MEKVYKFLNNHLCGDCDIKWSTLRAEMQEEQRQREDKLLKHYNELMDEQGRIMSDCASCGESYDWLEEHGGMYYYKKDDPWNCGGCQDKYC